LNEVLAQLKALPSGEIDNIDHREYVDIEYHTDVPLRPICANNLKMPYQKPLPFSSYFKTILSTEKMGMNRVQSV
jgi:exonuclease SbcD